VQFADGSDGDGHGLVVEFGDGATSAERDPEHVYPLPGTYSVRLRRRAGTAPTRKLRPDLVVVSEPPPTADFDAVPTQGFAPLIVQFTDQSLGRSAHGRGPSATARADRVQPQRTCTPRPAPTT
jgi:PKD repeat protein